MGRTRGEPSRCVDRVRAHSIDTRGLVEPLCCSLGRPIVIAMLFPPLSSAHGLPRVPGLAAAAPWPMRRVPRGPLVREGVSVAHRPTLSAGLRAAVLASCLLVPASAAAQPAPTPAQPPAAQPAGVQPPAAPGPGAAAHGTLVTIREVDRLNTALSSDITAAHTRLQQITALVLERSGAGGAQLVVDHRNEMGSTFRLVRATYSLDGVTVSSRVDDSGSLADQPTFAVYNGRVTSGEHSLTVNLEYQGNGYGIFSYLRGYTFRARSVQSFQVPEGRALRLVVIGYERGGSTTAVEERPSIRYTQTVMTLPEAQALSVRANAADSAAGPSTGAATPTP